MEFGLIKHVESIYAGADFPVILCDSDLKIVWFNGAVKKCKEGSSLESLLPDINIDALRTDLDKNGRASRMSGFQRDIPVTADFTAICEPNCKDKGDGYILISLKVSPFFYIML